MPVGPTVAHLALAGTCWLCYTVIPVFRRRSRKVNGVTGFLESSPTWPVRCMQFWLVVRDGVGRPEPLTTELNDGRRALSVFSFEEEAALFLRLCARRSWRVRATGIGELLSVLTGPFREVELVALDPLPQSDARALNSLLCVDRQRFVDFLLRKGAGH